MVKRVLACTLAMCLALQPVATYASTEEGKKASVVTKAIQRKSGTGSIQVTVRFSTLDISLEKTGLFVKLQKNGQDVQTTTLAQNLASDEEDAQKEANVKFDNLEPGEYQIVIDDDAQTGKFARYTQTILVESDVLNTIQLVDTYVSNALFETATNHVGTIGYGDFNQDGVINSKDEDALIQAIQTAKTATKENQSLYDLNQDGNVDLVDLQYFSYSYEKDKEVNNLQSTVETSVILDTSNVTVDTNESTTFQDAQGNTLDGEQLVQTLLKEEGSVQLKPKSDAVISEQNPVELSMNVDSSAKVEAITLSSPADNAISEGTISVETADGETIQLLIVKETKGMRKLQSIKAQTGSAVVKEDGSIVINLGKQIAIKKVVIKVTATTKSDAKLAEISKVEFVNDMASKIPAPELNIPTNVKAEGKHQEIRLSWDKQTNVTGYEIKIQEKNKPETAETQSCAGTSYAITSFQKRYKGKLENGKEYEVQVRSVNGQWNSPYSDVVTVSPVAEKIPDAPEGVSILAGVGQLSISWKAMQDTNYYTLYYREVGAEQYEKVEKIYNSFYTLKDLKQLTSYEIYLTGTNAVGTSKSSQIYTGKTVDNSLPITTKYKLINTSNGEGNVSAHIKDVTYKGGTHPENKFAIVDNLYSSAWVVDGDWTAGGSYPNNNVPPTVTFDEAYTMNHIILIPSANQQYSYYNPRVSYYNEEGKEVVVSGEFYQSKDANGKVYYEFWSDKPFTTNNIKVGLDSWGRYISYSELKFYTYDDIEEKIADLFTDATMVTLKETVTKDDVKQLRTRLDTPDSVSGEYHPKRSILTKILEQADRLLNNEAIKPAMSINTKLTTNGDSATKFARALNTWQSLGIVARAGEDISITVGRTGKKIGDNSELKLVIAQYNAEVTAWQKTLISNLKVGNNTIKISNIDSLAKEQGGNLYIQYTGSDRNADISVRVLGGEEVPVLDLKNVTDETQRKDQIENYIKQLEAYVPTIEEKHKEQHTGYEYKADNCMLQGTDIGSEYVMFSVPATQVLKGLDEQITREGKQPSTQTRADALDRILTSADTMMTLFYNHKGLSTDVAIGNKNRVPSNRLNVRYMTMFAGAFMYAASEHIGIGYGSVPGLFNLEQFKTTEDGRYESGNLFGWGIAHEIGHVINQGSYEVAEVTNNFYAQLAQSKDNNESYRMDYKDVYKDVTSGTKGSKSTSLTMYWQLHLAYDTVYNYTTYKTQKEMFDNLFYARVDTYDRNPAQADSDALEQSVVTEQKQVKLTLDGDANNNFMRLASAAAKKDLTQFFEAWGLVPNDKTKQYMAQYPKETRKLQYIDDNSKAFRVANQGKEEEIKAHTEATTVTANIVNPDVQSNSNIQSRSEVEIAITNDSSHKEEILGYEIRRNGVVVGFVHAQNDVTTFVDPIQTINNRVLNYEVIAYDRLLHTTKATTVTPIKIKNENTLFDKKNWTATTNMTSEQDSVVDKGEEHPDSAPVTGSGAQDQTETKSALGSIIFDNSTAQSYTGTTKDSDAEIVVNFHEKISIAGLQIKQKDSSETGIQRFDIYISDDGVNWGKAIKQGKFGYKDGVAHTYFDKMNEDMSGSDGKLYVYDTSYVKLVALGQQTVSIAELDFLAPAGDNVEIDTIGTLKEDFIYEQATTVTGSAAMITGGALVFSGEYRGNPAYNVVLLRDENNQIINGAQIIMAPDPIDGQLGNIESGRWIFFIDDPDYIETLKGKKIKVELYRVDNAETNEGERLVSDTFYVEIPNDLPDVTLQSDAKEETV